MHWQAENHHELLDSHCGSPNAFENRCRRFSLLNGTFAHRDNGSLIMVDVHFDTTRLSEANDTKIFGTADTSVDFAGTFDNSASLQRTLSALQRGPISFYRDSVIVLDEEIADYMLFVVSGVVRSCKIGENGSRCVLAFYLPGDLFGCTDFRHSLSVEAATDTVVLFLKRRSLLSLATRNIRIANRLLSATTNELACAQEHIMLMSKSAKCRVATFFTDLWVRLGKAKYLDVPMSYQDIADYLGLTIETLSRSITDLERSGLISRISGRKLLLRNQFALRRILN